MMVWDPMLGKYLAFGQLKSAALSEADSGSSLMILADICAVKDPSEDSPRPCCESQARHAATSS